MTSHCRHRHLLCFRNAWLAVAAIAAGCGFDSTSGLTNETSSLIGSATQQATQRQVGQVVYRAVGVNVPILTSTGTSSETVTWAFEAAHPDTPTQTTRVNYDRVTWEVSDDLPRSGGAAVFDLRLVAMTEQQARDLLANADYSDDFYGWSLHQPAAPGAANPIYAFVYGDETVILDAATREIEAIPHDLAAPAASSENSVSRNVIARATNRIQEIDSSAFIVWCGGGGADNQPLTQPQDTDVWRMQAVSFSAESEILAWSILYADGEFTIDPMEIPPFGVRLAPLNDAALDAADAWALVVEAGFEPHFRGWELVNPLARADEPPYYIFSTGEGFLLVNAETGEVLED